MKHEPLFRAGMAAVIVTMCGCGSGSVSETSGEGGAGGSGESPATGIGGSAVLAVHRIWPGDTTLAGQSSPDAWKVLGFDLDGNISTAQSTDLCQPLHDAKPEDVYPDGEDGIDNAFGRRVVPILLSLSPMFSSEANAAIHDGRGPTTLFRLAELGTDHVTSEALPCERDSNMPVPAWDGSDSWRARSDGLEGADPASPRARFAESEVVRDASGTLVWRARGADDLRVLIPMAGFTIPLPLRAVRISAVLSEDLTRMTAGRLGGVLDAKLFVHELSLLGADPPVDLCPSTTSLEVAGSAIYPAADILSNGSQDPALPCEGLSLGLGFEADAAGIAGVVEIPAPPCPP